MLRPFSSKYIASSAKYFFHGSWLPMATASNNSCVLRTSSSCVIVLPFAGMVEDAAVSSPDTSKNANKFFFTEVLQHLRRRPTDAHELDGGNKIKSQFTGKFTILPRCRI